MILIRLLFILIFVLLLMNTCLAEVQNIYIDVNSPGRIFEGIGSLSAGASSRLLMEYAEPQRRHILDFLFKPNFGASLHHLKVEVGGNVNSTDGTEPSHAFTREEFENPCKNYYERGYEWWLMKEAKNRKPEIFLDILPWGAPGWIGGGTIFSQDMADYMVKFIKGADFYHNLRIDYCGIWNECGYTTDYIKLLRKTLDENNLQRVEIVAPDDTGKGVWRITKDILKDPQLADAIAVVSGHYPSMPQYHDASEQYDTPQQLKDAAKRIWSGEDGPWRGDWQGAKALAKIYNRNYIRGKMVKTITWSLITSYYDNLPIPKSGLMKANTPWSGYYDVQPAVWATAHTTQFAQPGWRYLDSGCGFLAEKGSFVTLLKPGAEGDYSIVFETIDANVPQTVAFKIGPGLSNKPVDVWRSTEQSQFDQLAEIKLIDGMITLTLDPGAMYSLTTTKGQHKGTLPVPAVAEFPMPYKDDFEGYKTGKMARYFSDQAGIFETSLCPIGDGNCLRQVITDKGIEWRAHRNPEPYSVIGSMKWRDMHISCDVYIENAGYVAIYGRVNRCPQNSEPARGYWFKADANGTWEFNYGNTKIAAGKHDFKPNEWHNLKLVLKGDHAVSLIDNKVVCTRDDITLTGGMAGLGTGWNKACFDNFTVEPLGGANTPVNVALNQAAACSSVWDLGYNANFAFDGDLSTHWNAAEGSADDQWLEVDLKKTTRVSGAFISEFESRIRQYRLQCWNGAEWNNLFTGQKIGADASVMKFQPVTSDRFRLYIDKTNGRSAAICEFELFE